MTHSSQLAAAHRLHLAGSFDAAEAQYRALLSQHPDDADTRHLLGFLLYQSERLEEALAELRTAIASDQNRSDWQFTLGLVLTRLGRIDAAILAFEHATRLNAHAYFGWTNLGAAQQQAGLLAAAEASYLRARDLAPNQSDACYLLAALYLRLGRDDEARRCNALGVLADPPGQHPRQVRLHAMAGLGRMDEARDLLEAWLAEEPEHPVALHLRAAYRDQAPERCSPAFVAATFDRFAASFDHTISRLQYSGPRLVREHLAALGVARASLTVLDLGCGTGLIGMELAPYARVLIGVDLSPAMIQSAAERAIYTALHVADLVDHLVHTGQDFDLISCMDTLIYLGRLDDAFEQMWQHLRPGGRLIFTTELHDGPLSEPGYRLRLSGRYAHHPAYLAALLAQHGFVIAESREVNVRNEAGYPIRGQFVCASKPG